MTHIKHLVILAVVLCITASCSNDTVQDTNNSPSLWQYDGQRNVINTLIAKLKTSPEGKRLETNLGKRTLLWDATKAFRIEGKKRLLVPITNTKHSKIMGVVVFTQRNGKTHHDCINRRDIFGKGDFKAPFWKKGIWFGYITTLEDVYINKSGKTRGFWKKDLPNTKNTKSAKTYQCDLYEVQECWVNVLYEDETLDNVIAVDVVNCDISYEEDCYFVEDEDDDEDPVEDLINSPSGGGSSTPSLPVDDRIQNDLIGTARCIYEKLTTSNSALFKATIGKFIDDPKYNLVFRNGNCSNTDIACTNGQNVDINGEIIITIEDDEQPILELAATVLHEAIHAEIFRYVSSFESGVEPNNRKRLFRLYRYYKGLTGIYDNDSEAISDAQHVYMAENYVEPIAKAIRQLDSNRHPLEFYLWYGWEGLDTYDFQNKLTRSLKTTYNQNQTKVNNETNVTCD